MLLSLAHIDPYARLRNIVTRALNGSVYEGSASQDQKQLVIEAKRPDGTRVHLRFLGVQESESTAEPEIGAPMRLLGVSSAEKFSILRLFRPRFPPPALTGEVRVRIEAGSARMEIVCQDAEWWEDPPDAQTRAEQN